MGMAPEINNKYLLFEYLSYIHVGSRFAIFCGLESTLYSHPILDIESISVATFHRIGGRLRPVHKMCCEDPPVELQGSERIPFDFQLILSY